MTKKTAVDVYVPYVYYYLFAHKDELLVPLMRGSANVSLNEERLGKLRIPVPEDIEEQKRLTQELVKTRHNVESLKNQLQLAEKEFDMRFSELRMNF